VAVATTPGVRRHSHPNEGSDLHHKQTLRCTQLEIEMKKPERTRTVTIRISEEERAELDAYAIAKDIPRATVIRHLINKELKVFKETGSSHDS